MAIEVRKFITIIEETNMEAGKKVEPGLKRVAAVAVIRNPFAGNFVEELGPLYDIGEELGERLTEKAVQVLGAPVESYGKGAIVGVEGEIEHAAAIMHPKLGRPVRELIVGGKAIMPATEKIGNPGTEIDIPVHFKDAIYVRSHIDTMSIRVPDAPHADEILLAIVFTNGGRPLARIGGPTKEEAKKEDGLR